MHVGTYICNVRLEDAIKTENFTDERHKATLNVMYTAYWLKVSFNGLMKDKGITMEQFNVLRILKGKHPAAMCVKDIGSRIIEKSSNVPRIIDRLIIKNLVQRAPSKEDKRETLISLTEEGLRQLREANEALAGMDKEISGLTNDEAKELNKLLEKMRKSETV